MIQNYDTNGLIFALNFDAVGHDIRSPDYLAAIKNILDANKFDCIPLVDGERKRLNQNNLNDRAIYSKNGGNVTHIARRKIYDDEKEDIIITRIENIHHLSNDTELIEALVHFFDVKNNGDRCHFVISVGGSEYHPEALFTMHQLKQQRTLREIFGRIFIETLGKKEDTEDIVRNIFNTIKNYGNNPEWNECSMKLSKLKKSLSGINVEHASLYRQNQF